MAARTTTKRSTTKKRTAKRTATKAPAARKPTASKAAQAGAAPIAAGKPLKADKAEKPRSKSEVYSLISEHTGVSKKEVGYVFDAMTEIIKKDLSKTGPGEFKVPGMMKITVQRKPATKARKGINPFTGEPTTFAAKPARNVVKVRPLKGLKELV
ncbi:MAG: HU family DNA-binding protein [Phycisphaerales bacterium]|jgi:nucleoid DNA-binding protein